MLNDHTNFDDFGNALVTLIRIATSDTWENMAIEASVQPPLCSHTLHDCGPPFLVASLYFNTFVICTSIIIINLITSVISSNFEVLEVCKQKLSLSAATALRRVRQRSCKIQLCLEI
jgi:hypothetical protein